MDCEWRIHEGKDVKEKLRQGYPVLLSDEKVPVVDEGSSTKPLIRLVQWTNKRGKRKT